MQETLRNVADASRSLRESLDHVNNVAGSIDRGEGNLGRLARDESLIDEVSPDARPALQATAARFPDDPRLADLRKRAARLSP